MSKSNKRRKPKEKEKWLQREIAKWLLGDEAKRKKRKDKENRGEEKKKEKVQIEKKERERKKI